MAYPQKGASYTHKPKFMERAKAEERAKGGSVHMTAGSESGPGRLQKEAAREHNAKHEHPQKV